MHGFTVMSVQKSILINNQMTRKDFMSDLKLGASNYLGAIHDLAEHYPLLNCHPDTRQAVRQIILDWIHSERSASSFFWLYGPAGVGKTAILQAIAEFLCSLSQAESGQAFSFLEERKGEIKTIFCFQQLHINSL